MVKRRYKIQFNYKQYPYALTSDGACRMLQIQVFWGRLLTTYTFTFWDEALRDMGYQVRRYGQ